MSGITVVKGSELCKLKDTLTSLNGETSSAKGYVPTEYHALCMPLSKSL